MNKLVGGTLTPAYGRDYKNVADIVSAFKSGEDFVLHSGNRRTYCSVRDFEEGCTVILRYANFRLATTCIVPGVKNVGDNS